MQTPPKETHRFESLLEIVKALRGPEGCPWDKEQTHRSLVRFAIEEAHELAEAIEAQKTPAIIEELGDVLLQVALHAEIASQEPIRENRFTIEDVLRSINEKMIRRHPHVFASAKAESAKDVLENWEILKAQEKKDKKTEERFDIPVSLSALLRAQKIGEKTKKASFDWPDVQGVLAKVEEELAELKEAIQKKGTLEQESELGDLLFSVVQLARHLDIDAEQALRTTNQRFENRFFTMLRLIKTDGYSANELQTAELERYWQKAKGLEIR